MRLIVGARSPMQTTKIEVAVVGGGFSGAILAAQLLRCAPGCRLAMIDPGPQPGRGVAFSADKSCHLLNVRCGWMSAFPGKPDHFLEWARTHHRSSVQHSDFLPRGVYGQYIDSLLNDVRTRCSGGAFEWVQDEVVSVCREASRLKLRLQSGQELVAQFVVLATGNNKSTTLKVPGLSASSKRYVSSGWSNHSWKGIPQTGNVLLIGSGLTSVDVAVALRSEGFVGGIHIVSRHGLIPQVHRQSAAWPAFFKEPYPKSVRGLLRRIRSEVYAASRAGVDWRSVIDALRPVTPRIWQSLSIDERERFLRHLLPYWNVHRHRMAPEVGAVIHDLIRNRQISVYTGCVKSCVECAEHLEVHFHNRKSGKDEVLRVDRMINCTGPEADFRRVDAPLFQSLFEQGLARPDPLFLGLDVDADGRLLDRRGEPSRSLYAIGPIRKGSLWETTAVPEIRVQAAELAALLARNLGHHQFDNDPVLVDASRRQYSSNAERARWQMSS